MPHVHHRPVPDLVPARCHRDPRGRHPHRRSREVRWLDVYKRQGIGRVYSGTIHTGDQILVVKNDGERKTATVKQL